MNCGHLEKLPWCLWVCVFVSSVPHVPPGTPGNNTSHEQWSFLAGPSPQSQLCSWTPVQISAPPSSPLTDASVYYLIWLSGPQRSLEKDPGQNRIACTVRGWEIFSDLGSRSESHKYREVSLVSKTATRSNWRGQSGGRCRCHNFSRVLKSVFVFIVLSYGCLSFFPLSWVSRVCTPMQGNSSPESIKSFR